MSTVSIVAFVLGLFYLIVFFIEIPFFYEGNPKSRLIIKKLGKKGYKALLLFMATIMLFIAVIFK